VERLQRTCARTPAPCAAPFWWVRELDPFDHGLTYRLCARVEAPSGPPAVLIAVRTFSLEQLEGAVVPNPRDAIADELRSARRELRQDVTRCRRNVREYHAQRFAT
jgi:hypothetical protein